MRGKHVEERGTAEAMQPMQNGTGTITPGLLPGVSRRIDAGLQRECAQWAVRVLWGVGSASTVALHRVRVQRQGRSQIDHGAWAIDQGGAEGKDARRVMFDWVLPTPPRFLRSAANLCRPLRKTGCGPGSWLLCPR